MADQGLIAPLMSDDPASSYQAYFDAQRKQMLAQMLMQHAANAGQTPADWNQMRAVPRANPLTTIGGGIAAALMAKKALRGAQKAQQDYMTGLMGSSGQPAPAQPAPQQSMQPAAPPMIRNPDLDPNAPTGAPIPTPNPSTPSNQQPSQSPISGFQAWKSALDQSKEGRFLRVTAPNEYAKLVAEQAAKFGMPENVREGGSLVLPDGRVVYTAAKDGISTTYGPNGPSASLVPGYEGASAQLAGSKERAVESNRLFPLPNEVGRPGYVLGSQAAGAQPPTQTGNPSPQAQPPAMPRSPWQPSVNDPFPDAPKYKFGNTIYMPEAKKREENEIIDMANDGIKNANITLQKTQKHTYDVRNLADAFKNSYMGPGSDARALGSGVLSALGISSADQTKKLAATEVADKLGIVFGTEASKAELGPGQRMTQSEWNVLLNRGAPNHKLLPYAAADVLTLREAQNRYEQQRESDRLDYLQAGHDPRFFDNYYAKTHPQKDFMTANAPKIQAEIYQRMGLPPEKPAQVTAAGQQTQRRVLNGVTYVKINGQWHAESK